MSKSIIKIKEKSTGKIFIDLINDTCDVHNLYDETRDFYGSFKSWELSYDYQTFNAQSNFEELDLSENEALKLYEELKNTTI